MKLTTVQSWPEYLHFHGSCTMPIEDNVTVQDDPTDEFVTKGMKIGSPAYLYTCKCCGASFNGKKLLPCTLLVRSSQLSMI